MNQDVALDVYLASIRDDAERIAVATDAGDLDASVPSCPDWNLRKLVVHTGSVHRWATSAIEARGEMPTVDVTRPDDDADGAAVANWFREGSSGLAAAIETADPQGPCWHPFPYEQSAWVMARRQAMETMIHRWDAEASVGTPAPLPTDLAVAGLAEFFEMLVPRALGREGATAPDVSIHVHCTDDGLETGTGEWIAWGEAGEYRMEPVHRKGDVVLRGDAESLLLTMMGRAGSGRGDLSTVDVVGDTAAADAWFALPGL